MWLLATSTAHAALAHESGSSAHAAVAYDNQNNWYTLRSKRFTVHFHDGLEDSARRFLALAERVHDRVSDFIGWKVDRLDIVLSDGSDIPNGYTTPLTNRIVLFLAPADEFSSLEDYNNWLELVFTHEYLHALHLARGDGGVEELRALFGSFFLLFPNVFQPLWLIEGLATYMETDEVLGVGRGQSSYYEMLMRVEVANGLKPLAQLNQATSEWPVGDIPYLYGVYFYQFIADRYGEDKIQRLVELYSDNLLPFRVNSTMRSVLGKEYPQLWGEFEIYLKERFASQLGRPPDSREQRLTQNGYLLTSLEAADDILYYVSADGLRRPGVFRYDTRTQESERLLDTQLKQPYRSPSPGRFVGRTAQAVSQHQPILRSLPL